MQIPFTKMNGAGNDFVVIDNRGLEYNLSKEQIAALCDRHRGIGADGLLAVEPSEAEADFKFRYYNADGGEAEMCGNGARCFGKYTASLMPEKPDEVTFETIAGILSAKMVGDDVRIEMSDPFGLENPLPFLIEGLAGNIYALNTGVPHTVAFADSPEELDKLDVIKFGAAIRYHEHFAPAGTNANFGAVREPGHIVIRTYERGVEDETLACGTGMVASAIFHHLLTGAPSPVKVDVKGGETLEIGFERDADRFHNVTLTGPAEVTFSGVVEL
ncbi:MAG: diaminopimelate epimerase [Verrucomicrobiota bacterium JB023]|nr:diaminopimelate epimerase [Verrucomicrobiota bacterium JB023]